MRHSIFWPLLAALLLTAAAPRETTVQPGPAPRLAALDTKGPPPSWRPQDPADSLYRAARAALNRSDFRQAADLFRQIHARHAGSAYAPDAFYWEAFALYRLGGSQNLRTAQQRLEAQRERHPRAATRADADVLATRVRGELARLGDAPAAEQVSRQASRAATSCPDEDLEIRAAALNALVEMNAAQALTTLRSVLARRDACSAKLREKAVFLVADRRLTGSEDILLEVARHDPDPRVREQAVFWLSEIPTERAVATLEEILRSSSDHRVREKAIFALSQHKSPRAMQLLRRAAEQADLPVELRERAIFGLHENRSAENAAFLRELYGRLREPQLKEKVLFAAAEMRGQGNERWLLSVAVNASEPVELRKKALFWASESRTPIGEIAGFYDRFGERELRKQVIFILSQRREPAALDKLIEIARNERDPELRKQAVFWLSESSDPRAVRVLQEIIGGS